jgi:pimeloyl-ACP methyl ester carboxylesterase
VTGLIVWIGLFVLEIGLFVFAYRSRSFEYVRIRNVRIATFILLLVLGIFGIITWSFRYDGLFVLILSMILGTQMKVLKEQKESKSYTVKRHMKKTVMVILLFGLVMVPAVVFPDYEPLAATGPYTVETSSYVFEDSNRRETFSDQKDYRQVGVSAWFPDNENEIYPLIVFSHGGISLVTSNESLFLELASHGYIVFSIGHPYHSIVTKNANGNNVWIDKGYMNELNRENARENPNDSHELYQKWMDLRTGDLDFIIERTQRNVRDDPDLFKRIDRERIGVIGHSLGGSAALCLGRNRNDVQAIIALESPYMCDISGVEDKAFVFDDAAYPVPVLNIYSDSTWHFLSVFPQYEQNHVMLNDPESVVFNLHIDGTGHFSLTDLSLTSPLMTRMLNGFPATRHSKEVLKIINEESLAFLDLHLK